MSRIRERRPTRSPSSQPSRALRTTAWRAALGVKPSSRSEPISASCHAPSGRGSRNSPSTVSSVERAAGAPTERRRRTSSTRRDASVRRHDGPSAPRRATADALRAPRRAWTVAGDLAHTPGMSQAAGDRQPRRCIPQDVANAQRGTLALVGGTVADVYTGTWIQANVEIEDGVITYVGPREPAAERVASTSAARSSFRATSSRTPTRGACTRRPRCSRSAIPDGTTTLVYDNLFFFLAHGVDGLRAHRRPDARRAGPRLLDRADRPQSAYPDEADAVRHRGDRAAAAVARGRRVGGDHQLERGGSRGAAGRRGHRRGQASAPPRRGPQRGRLLQPPQRARARGDLVRPRGDHGRGGAAPPAARDVDDAAPVLAAARPRRTLSTACSTSSPPAGG